ncbi:hypothetical protein PghCCS26_13310 [Paenibacillus glycanilyticus]|uniref:Uncharacterized protein n=1 Tax=Paenibacillus glycanilyticus TaxID=126569 RepID=A0ABQ6NJL3_9BACL|nr:hypothetical protein PghCCS26_13310 [Paenibacillus glycanilyticus]
MSELFTFYSFLIPADGIPGYFDCSNRIWKDIAERKKGRMEAITHTLFTN